MADEKIESYADYCRKFNYGCPLFQFTIYIYNHQTEQTRSETVIAKSVWDVFSQVKEGRNERHLTHYEQNFLTEAQIQQWQRCYWQEECTHG